MMKMQKFAKQAIGFTLIELMIVIAIIGILAAVAIPQYQKYAVRSKATQTLNAIRPFQLAMAEYAIMNQKLPGTVNELPGINIGGEDGDLETATCNGIVQQVLYNQDNDTQATLTATFYDDDASSDCSGTTRTLTVPTDLATETIAFVGTVNNTGAITWSVDEDGSSVKDAFLPDLGVGIEEKPAP